MNASLASASSERFEALLTERPRPGAAHTWGSRLGLVAAALIVGAGLAAVIGTIGLVLLVLLLVAGVAVSGRTAGAFHRRRLRHDARQAQVGEWVAARGWRYSERIGVTECTPLLRAGDERKTGWGVEGSLDDGTSFAAGFYQYTEERTVTFTDSEGRTSTRTERTDYPFTLALIEAPLDDLEALTLRRGRTGGLLSRVGGALGDLRPVPLESEEFNRQFELMVADDADDVAIRACFTPAVQMAFVERGAGASRVEAEQGMLVVARDGAPKHDDFGALMDVLGDAVWLRAVLTSDPPGRLPDVAALRALLLTSAAG